MIAIYNKLSNEQLYIIQLNVKLHKKTAINPLIYVKLQKILKLYNLHFTFDNFFAILYFVKKRKAF